MASRPPPIPVDAPYKGDSYLPNGQYQPPSSDAGMRMLLPVDRSGWAIAAGYLGLFGVLVVPAPFALIAGIMAIRDIKKSQQTDTPKYGMGRAVFGLVIGTLGSLFLLFMLLGLLFYS